MSGQFVKNGATLKCPLCSSNGTLIVSHTEVQLQNTPFATNGDRSKSNLVFGGVCNKWRKNKPPCSSVIAPTQWNGVASDLEIDGEFMLLDSSTIGCATGGVDISILHTAQMDAPTDLVEEPSNLRKFHVNFRRGSNYKGEYGFDWMRDEYIYPIEFVGFGNNQGYKPLSVNPDALKNQYKSFDVLNPITPYGKDYFPSWLSLFSVHTYWMFNNDVHPNGVQLSLEIVEVEPLIIDSTKLIFESSSNQITISPSEIQLSDFLTHKETKDLGDGSFKVFYTLEDIINISCYRPITEHEEVKVFAELEGQKEEVGKLMIYKNDQIPTLEVVLVKVINSRTAPEIPPGYINKIQDYFLNQALISLDIYDEIEFNIQQLARQHTDAANFLRKYITSDNTTIYGEKIVSYTDELNELYTKYGSDQPKGGIMNASINKKTYIFYSSVNSNIEDGYVPSFGNSIFLTKGGYTTVDIIAHEIGHSLSLAHSFSSALGSPHVFYAGKTDNIMDYYPITQKDEIKGNLFKWQWDIMRKDKSIVY